MSPFLCSERDDGKGWGGIGETDPLEFGVLPLRVTRQTGLHAGGRAAWRSSPPWLAEELGCQVGREWVRDRLHCLYSTDKCFVGQSCIPSRRPVQERQDADCIDTGCAEDVYGWADITSALCSHFMHGREKHSGTCLMPPHNVAVMCPHIHVARPLIRTVRKHHSLMGCDAV